MSYLLALFRGNAGLPSEAVQGPAVAAATWMVIALTAYVLLGVADFGSGVWDLLARGPRASLHRQLIARRMGPIWEANHVWLIFFAVVLFSAFPPAFAGLSTALFLPLHLVLLGIVMRGSAFVLRTQGPVGSAFSRFWAASFGVASLLTPFLLGVALGSVTSGGIRVTGAGVQVAADQALLAPYPLLTGLLAVALSAYLAAVYLAVEAPRGEMRGDFRRRALWSGAVSLGLSALLIPVAGAAVPWLTSSLLRPRALLLVGGAGVLGLTSLWALARSWFGAARLAAAGYTMLLLWSWALAQWPYLIYPDLTVLNSAAPVPTLRLILRLLSVGLIVLVPSLVVLFRVFHGENPKVPTAGRRPI